ncbi:MAG: EamA family transporter RarD [Planctomycetota bacterium]
MEPVPAAEIAAGAVSDRGSESEAFIKKTHSETHNHVGHGLAFALTAYLWWGFMAFYFKAVAHVSPFLVLSHRIVWCSLALIPLLTLRRQWPEVRSLMRSGSAFAQLSVATLLIAVNWGVFIYAISVNRLAEASLGYFINPLISVLLGMLFLGERLRPAQWVALVFAACGVAYLTVRTDSLPWISLTLAVTFGFYGLVRKRSPAGPLVGLFFETSLLTPLAGGFLVFAAVTGSAGNLGVTLPEKSFAWVTAPVEWTLLIGGGLITAVPLLCFAAATRRLRLSTVGFVQYLAPTLQFLIAVLIFGEPFDAVRLVSFGMIWLAVLTFIADSLVRVVGAARKTDIPRTPDRHAAEAGR